MRHFIYAFFALALIGPLAACGFTPLYADGPQGAGNISVEQIDGRSGHALRKALLQELAPGLPGLDGSATLTVVLDQGLKRLTFQPDEAATRSDVAVKAEYVLVLSDTAISGTSTAETSFLVPDTPFADITAQIDAPERAVTLLARRIVDDLRISMANIERASEAGAE